MAPAPHGLRKTPEQESMKLIVARVARAAVSIATPMRRENRRLRRILLDRFRRRVAPARWSRRPVLNELAEVRRGGICLSLAGDQGLPAQTLTQVQRGPSRSPICVLPDAARSVATSS